MSDDDNNKYWFDAKYIYIFDSEPYSRPPNNNRSECEKGGVGGDPKMFVI